MKAVWFGLAGLVAAVVAAVSWFAYERAQVSEPAAITDSGAAPGGQKQTKAQPAGKAAPADKAEADKTPEEKAGAENSEAAAKPPAGETGADKPAKKPEARTADAQEPAGERPAADAPATEPPSFDVVRVEPDGSTVIAGRAAPGWKVRVEAQGKLVGEAVANARGEWVIVADAPLPTGSSSLKLMAASPDGVKQTVSPQRVAVSRPADQKLASAEPAPKSPAAADEQPEAADKQPDADPAGDTADSVKAAPDDPASAEAGDKAAAASAHAKDENAPAAGDAGAPAAAPGAGPEAKSASRSIKPAGTEPAGAEPAGAGDKPASAGMTAETPAPKAPLVVVSEKDKPSRVLQAPEPEPAAPKLTFRSVDYDDSGKVILSGKSDAGKTLRIYLNNRYIGETSAGETGEWVLRTEQKIEPGRYTLRVDQIGGNNKIAARVEAPFERAEPKAAREARQNGEVVIQPGDNLWNLSRAFYGEGMQYTVIYEANKNKIRNPSLIYPGQVFVTPKADPESRVDEREDLRQRMLRMRR